MTKPRDQRPPRSPLRRVAGRALRVVLWSAAALVLLIGVALAALASGPGRRQACERVETLADEALVGDVALGQCAAVTLWHLRVEDVTVRSPGGARVLSVASVDLRPDLGALARGELRAREVVISGPEVSLAEEGEQLALFAALAVEESPDAPPEEPAEEGGSPPAIFVDSVRIERGRVTELPEALSVRGLTLDATAVFDEHLEVEVRRLTAAVDRGAAGEVARLERLEGEISLAPGGASRLEAALRSGEDSVDARVGMRWGDAGPEHVDGEVTLALSPALLERFGQSAAASTVDSSLRGTVRARGSLDDLEVEADLETDGGPVDITASLVGERVEVSVGTTGLELSRVVDAAPEGQLAVRLSAAMDHALGEAAERPVEVRVQGLRYLDYELPELTARGALAPAEVRIAEIEVPHLTRDDGHLEVEGRLGFDGSADVTLDARLPELDRDGNLRRLAPGVRGDVTASVRATMDAGETPRIDVRGRAVVARVEAPGLRLERAELSGSARGARSSPVLSVDLAAVNLRAGGQHLAEASLTARGGPSRYEVDGRAALADGTRADLDIDVLVRGDTYRADGDVVAHGLWQGPIRLRLDEVVVDPRREVRFERVRASGLRLAATATGAYRFRGPSSVEGALSELDLALLDRALHLDRDLEGTATAELSFSGTPTRPEVEARVELTEARVEAVPIPHGVVVARLSSRAAEAELRVDVDLGEYGDLSARALGELARGRAPARALSGGRWDGTVEARQVTTAIAHLFAADLPPLEGVVDALLRVEGSMEDPRITLSATGTDLATEGIEPVTVVAELALASDHLDLDIRADDDNGQLVSLRADATVDLEALARSGQPAAILEDPWTVAVAVPARSPRALPVEVPDHEGLPESVSVDLEVCGGSGAIRGDATVVGRWGPVESAGGEGCRPGAPPELHVTVALRDGETELHAWADLPEEEVADATVRLSTPVERWLEEGLPSEVDELAAVAADLRIDLPLEAVPVACGQGSGRVTARVDATGLLGEAPRVALTGTIAELRLGEGEAVDVELVGTVEPGSASAEAHLRAGDREALFLEAELPLLWGGEVVTPELVDAPWQARVRLDRAPVAPLLAPAPGLSQPSGWLDGELSVRGRGGDVALLGEVTFEDLGMTIHEPFQRLDDLDGTLRFEEERVVVEGLELRDGDGRLELDAAVAMSEWRPTAVEARLRATRFPLRNEGVIFARATSLLRIEADLEARPRRARVVMEETAVALPDESGRMVQRLDQHPDVVFEDQAGFLAEAAETSPRADDGAAEAAAAEAIPMEIALDATEPFWVRHTDFALQLTAELHVGIEGGQARISGPLRVRRGFLVMLGKSFDFEAGELTFAGGRTVDPVLDLRAVHTLRSDHTVTVSIGGRLSSPELTFSTTVPGVETEREILALLVTGRSGADAAETAEEQAVSMLASVTAGLLSSFARRQLGGVVPVFAIESHGTTQTRVRAGLQADRIIPSWLRRVVRGVYVEGYVGTRPEEEEGGGASVTGGASVELYFPYDLVTTGAYEEPDNWSVDLTWEP